MYLLKNGESQKRIYKDEWSEFEHKIPDGYCRGEKRFTTLVGDSAVMFGRFEQDVNQASDQAKEDLTTWVNDGITRMSEKLGKFPATQKRLWLFLPLR